MICGFSAALALQRQQSVSPQKICVKLSVAAHISAWIFDDFVKARPSRCAEQRKNDESLPSQSVAHGTTNIMDTGEGVWRCEANTVYATDTLV